jgi:crossover junction endodeoxyribonuclease RusA
MVWFLVWVPGEPVPKGRPRVYRGRGVTPKRTRDAEERVAKAFRLRYPRGQPLTGPVIIRAEYWMSKRGHPDWDNLAKLTTDALNGLAYEDDAQIMRADIRKITPDPMVAGKRGARKRKPGDPLTYHGVAYEPHTVISVTPYRQGKAKETRSHDGGDRDTHEAGDDQLRRVPGGAQG